jgi:hypothetical protein
MTLELHRSQMMTHDAKTWWMRRCRGQMSNGEAKIRRLEGICSSLIVRDRVVINL